MSLFLCKPRKARFRILSRAKRGCRAKPRPTTDTWAFVYTCYEWGVNGMEHPARVGKYEVEQFLGGGMSRVYRAKDTVLGRQVALKILSDGWDADGKARFLNEARLACSARQCLKQPHSGKTTAKSEKCRIGRDRMHRSCVQQPA